MRTSMKVLRHHFAIAALGASGAIAGCSAEVGTPEEVTEVAQAVVNGDVVSTAGTPSVAIYNNTTRPCSGVYMGNRWVMTSRHCVNNTTQSNLHVTSLLSPGPALPSSRPAPRWRTVSSIVYPTDASLDLALIKLSGDLANATGGTMSPATRANAASDLAGQELLCRGYGRARTCRIRTRRLARPRPAQVLCVRHGCPLLSSEPPALPCARTTTDKSSSRAT